jgi:protein phosphatase PTC2/3
MVVAEWFFRFGQILAPDENFKGDREEGTLDDGRHDQFSIWNVVAPDPNFARSGDDDDAAMKSPVASTSRQTPLSAAHSALLHTPASALPAGSTASTPASMPCAACQEKLCATCRASCCPKEGGTGGALFSPGAMLFSPPPRRPSTRKSEDDSSLLLSPRSSVPADADASTQQRALVAATQLARQITSPQAKQKPVNRVMLKCGNLPKGDGAAAKQMDGLRKDLSKHPSLIHEVSVKAGNDLPDGYTSFLVAASRGNLDALRVIWNLACDGPERFITRDELLLQRTTEGETAYHLAFPGAPYPHDLAGVTPLGAALTSVQTKARENRKHMLELLYRKDDPAIQGNPKPLIERMEMVASLRLTVGMAEIPGKRVYMEDFTISDVSSNGLALFVVADGHDDANLVSEFVARNLVTKMKKRLQGETPLDEDWSLLCTDVCLDVDSLLKKKSSSLSGGSVAVMVTITEKLIIVANVGDSRCILVQTQKADDVDDLSEATKKLSLEGGKDSGDSSLTRYVSIALSRDHKPSVPEEVNRIQNAGFEVLQETHMQGGQPVVYHKIGSGSSKVGFSRSFGDFEFKTNTGLSPEDQAVTAAPEVTLHSRCSEDAFVILACDGVWDVMTNEEVGSFVAKRTEYYKSIASASSMTPVLPIVCDELLDECLTRGSQDNMSVTIVALSNTADAIQAASGARALFSSED